MRLVSHAVRATALTRRGSVVASVLPVIERDEESTICHEKECRSDRIHQDDLLRERIRAIRPAPVTLRGCVLPLR